jgi:hypothetical protein
MSASGGYGPTRVAAGIVGLVDLTIGARAEDVLRAHMARRRPALQGHPPRRRLGGQGTGGPQQPHQSAASSLSRSCQIP